MKRILQIFAALMALGGVKAAEYTTVEQLTENYYQLVVNDGGTNKSLYISDGWDLAVGNTAEVVNNSNNYYLFKVVQDGDNYILNCYNYAGDKRSSHMGDAINITGNSTGLFIGSSGSGTYTNGQDKDNGGRWIIAAVSGGFTFQNVGDNYYISISPALTSSASVTLTCYDKDSFVNSGDQQVLTSLDALTNNKFVLDLDGTWYWNSESNQNAVWSDNTSTVIGNSEYYYLFQASPITVDGATHYVLNVYNKAGEAIDRNGGQAFQPYLGGYFVGACDANSTDHPYTTPYDSPYTGLWDIEVSDGKFAFKSCSQNADLGGKYLQANAVVGESPAYWTCFVPGSSSDTPVPGSDNDVVTTTYNVGNNTVTINVEKFFSEGESTKAAHGTVTATITGSTIKLNITPDDGYKIGTIQGRYRPTTDPNGDGGGWAARQKSASSLPIQDGWKTLNIGTDYTFEMPEGDVEITVNFEQETPEPTHYTLTVNTEWVTFCSPVTFAVPTGLEAYIITSVSAPDTENGTATLTQQDYVVANTPMVLKNTNTSITTFDITEAASGALTATPCNEYKGSTTSQTIANGTYVLKDGAFMRTYGGTLPAYHCYLDLNSASGARSLGIVIDGETTAVKTVKSAFLKEDVWYNLNGIRTNSSQKGVYIKNGKKIIVK